MNLSKNSSVENIIDFNLITRNKFHVENYQLIHDVLLRSMEVGIAGEIIRTVITYIPKIIVGNVLGINSKNINRLAKKT